MDTGEAMSDREHLRAVPRIVVVGNTSAGKTTLAQQLSRHLMVPHIELDALYWEPDWTPAALEVFRQRTARAVQGEAWIADGNYRGVRDLVWGRAATVIWLDYPLPVILWRLLWRTLRRVLTREELWNGNREQASQAIFSRDSLFVWALQTHLRRRREYSALFASEQYPHLHIVRLRSPAMTKAWLATILTSEEV